MAQMAAPTVIEPGETPESFKRRQLIAQALMAKGMSDEPIQHWTQGAARMAQAAIGGGLGWRAGEDQKDAKRQAIANAMALVPQDGGQTQPAVQSQPTASVEPSGGTPQRIAQAHDAAGGVSAHNPSGDPSQIAFNHFASKYGPAAASGIVGNLMAESRLNTGAINRGDGRDGSDSIGIGQWNGPRAVALRQFAAQNGLNPSDLQTQLKFVDHELGTTENRTLASLQGAKDPRTAALAFAGYERPAGWTPNNPAGAHNAAGRIANAEKLHAQYGGGTQVAQAGGGAMPRPQPNRAAMLKALSDENLPAPIAAVLMQHMKPSEYGFQMTPDGTLLRTDARGGSVAPIYKSGSKPKLTTIKVNGEDVSVWADESGQIIKPVDAGSAGGGAPANPYAMTGKTTEDERKVSGYANRTVESHNVINELEKVGTDLKEAAKAAVPGVGNLMITKEKQRLLQAQRNFVNAVLRRESGAVIAKDEFDNATQQYFPQPGDAPEVIEQKRRNREETIEGLMGSAGRNYKPPTTYKRSAPSDGWQIIDGVKIRKKQ
jgi:hypothetical protein